MDHISIIIVHYNTDRETRECLQSLAGIEAKDFRYNILIVDNASKKPLKVPQHLLSEKTEILRSESNLGFTGGNNLGIKYAIDKYNSDYVVLLNSDTLVDKKFLVELYGCMKASEKVGMISPKIYFAKNYEYHRASYKPAERGKVLWYGGGSIDWQNLVAYHRGVDELDRGQFDAQRTSDFATGCCVLIKREVLETVGLLDDSFFLYLEDVEWSVRAHNHGFQIGFCPESIVWHKNAGSTGGAGSPVHQYYQSRNRVWFALRYGNWRIKLTTVRFALQLLISGSNPEQKAMIDILTGNLGKRTVV